MKGVNLVPSKNKNKKTIQWILDDDVVDILPKPFINSLMHGAWQPLSEEAKIISPNTQIIDLIPTGKRMS